ncbi:hypothetical protein BKI51_03805 [Alphaproteobacteria bacterium AO1-B]|nr:hypothetical protein BKI51_03805 [Alphaproteobacteria bacterium AO1-B]
MNGVLIALHLVACQPNLLVCEDLSASREYWEDMDACQMAREPEMDRARDDLPDETVVMSRCRHTIAPDARTAPIF